MKKIIPFKKEIIFKTNLAEITSISLEHSLHKEGEHLVSGSFSLNGEYKVTDTSTNTEIFSYDLPFDIHMDDHYILDHITVDIDDFYYEIVNENVLSVHIDVCVDKLEERPLIEPIEKEEFPQVLLKPDVDELVKEAKADIRREIEEDLEREEKGVVKEEIKVTKKDEKKEEVKIEENEVNSLFGSMNESSETYMAYHVYIIREGDSIESILNKYGISKENLAAYNDLSEIKLGDKLIIPALYHATGE